MTLYIRAQDPVFKEVYVNESHIARIVVGDDRTGRLMDVYGEELGSVDDFSLPRLVRLSVDTERMYRLDEAEVKAQIAEALATA